MITDAPAAPPVETPRFPSFTSLRAAHIELLKRHREQGDTPEMLVAMLDFVVRGKASGALLDSDEERQAAQSLLDYWATRHYRAGQHTPDATLDEFDPNLAPELDDSLCPYVGLETFRDLHHHLFFGRRRLVDELVNKLKTDRLLAVLGASGSGKSSVVRAGLIPALENGAWPGSENWFYFTPLVPGSHPLSNLARLTLPPDVDEARVQSEADRYRADSGHLARLIAERSGGSIVLVVDQFEEAFTLCHDDGERQAFVNNLVSLTTAPDAEHRVILTMRTDFETQVARLPDFQPLFEKAVARVTPLNNRELREAIEQPAKVVGLKFEEGLVEALLRDVLGEEAALPLLQFTLLKLWERRERNRVTWEAYRQLGGGRQALATSADEFFNSLIPEDQDTARRILLKLVTPGEGREVTSRRVRKVELYHKAEASDRIDRVLDKLLKARLLKLSEGDTETDDQVEVAHEALVRNWPRLVEWLDEQRVRLRRRRRLTAAAEQWLRLGKDPSALWRGTLLEEAQRYDDLSELEAEFIQVSLAAEAAEVAEKEAARQRELEAARKLAETERETALRLRARNRIITAVGVVTVIAALFAVFFGVQANRNATLAQNNAVAAEAARTIAELNADQRSTSEARAQAEKVTAEAASTLAAAGQATARAALADVVEQKATAEAASTLAVQRSNVALSRQLAAQAQNFFDSSQVDLGLLFGVEAYRLGDTAEAKGVLLAGLQRSLGLTTAPFGSPLPAQEGYIYSLAFSPDGEKLASGDSSGLIVVWDAQTQTPALHLVGHTAQVYDLSFSPDGKRLASGSADGTLILWDTATGALLQQFGRTEFWYLSVAFHPKDGSILASGSDDNRIRLWDLTTLTVQRELAGHLNDVWSLAWSPDGRQLASGSGDTTARIWDPVQGGEVRSLRGQHTDTVRDVAWSPNGRVIATAGREGNLVLWDAASGQVLSKPLSGQAEGLLGVDFSRDSKLLASGGANRAIQVWNVERPAEPRLLEELVNHRSWVISVAFSRRGRNLLASGSADRTIQLREVVVQQPLSQELSDGGAAVRGAAFDTGEQLLILEQSGNAVTVHNRGANQPLQRFSVSAPLTAALSTDGDLLAVVNADGAVRVWNVTIGQPLPIELNVGDPAVQSLAISAPRQLLAASRCAKVDPNGPCQQNEISLWRLTDGQRLGTLSGHTDLIISLAFDTNSSRLASGSQDGTILMWDIATQQALSLLAGRTDPVTSLAFSPSGLVLASGGSGGKLLLWDATPGRPGQPIGNLLPEAQGNITSLVFSPDGKELISGTETGAIVKWNVDIASWLARTCELAGRNLTREEWDQFFLDRPYRKTCEALP